MCDEANKEGRTITIHLTASAGDELDRLKEITGASTARIIQSAMTLFRIHAKAAQDGETIKIDHGSGWSKIDLPGYVNPNQKGKR